MSEAIVARKSPYKVAVEAGRGYLWCACGRSQKQPFCDGSHSVTDIRPIQYKAEESKDVWFCGCKSSGNKPFCDGTHSTL